MGARFQVDESLWGSPRPGALSRPKILAKRDKPGGSLSLGLEPQGASLPYKCLFALQARRSLGISFRFWAEALPRLQGGGGVRGDAIQTFRVFSREIILSLVKRGEKLCHS